MGESETAVEFAWAEYRRWAATSGRLDAAAKRTRAVVFALALCGPAFAAIGAQIEGHRPVAGEAIEAAGAPIASDSGLPSVASAAALLSGLCVTVAAFVARQAAVGGVSPNAARARAVAEGLKSLAWRRAAAPPAPGEADPTFEQVTRIASSGDGILLAATNDSDKRKGCPAEPLTVDGYVAGRIEDQIRYYRNRAVEHAAEVRKAGNTSLGIGVAAIVLIAFGAYSTGTSWAVSAAWGAVLGAWAAALSTWFQSEYHARVAATYQGTATQIAATYARWRALPEGSRTLVELVTRCEDHLEAEHGVWRQVTLENDAPASGAAAK